MFILRVVRRVTVGVPEKQIEVNYTPDRSENKDIVHKK